MAKQCHTDWPSCCVLFFFLPVDPRLIQEDKSEKERIQRVNQEVFGDGPQPKLEFAQYKVVETFKPNSSLVEATKQ